MLRIGTREWYVGIHFSPHYLLLLFLGTRASFIYDLDNADDKNNGVKFEVLSPLPSDYQELNQIAHLGREHQRKTTKPGSSLLGHHTFGLVHRVSSRTDAPKALFKETKASKQEGIQASLYRPCYYHILANVHFLDN